ncbi:MAG: hypothetical protein ACLU4N_23405 [Butyricimonas faecihominis]
MENNPNLPIFIMDNFETTIQKVYDMDPNRIESITILKDAGSDSCGTVPGQPMAWSSRR